MGLFQVSNGIRGGTAFKFSIAMEILDDIKIVWWKKSSDYIHLSSGRERWNFVLLYEKDETVPGWHQ